MRCFALRCVACIALHSCVANPTQHTNRRRRSASSHFLPHSLRPPSQTHSRSLKCAHVSYVRAPPRRGAAEAAVAGLSEYGFTEATAAREG